MKILANDGIDKSAKTLLEAAGHSVVTDKVDQANIKEALKDFDGIIVRSATTVRQDVIEANLHLKFIARAGVGIDNIDHEIAKQHNIPVINTPAASSISVAELVFSHLFGAVRFLHLSNRDMPAKGAEAFNNLKKQYAEGIELYKKTIGIVGFGRIGREVARIATGIGMSVIAFDPFISEDQKNILRNENSKLSFGDLDTILANAHFISFHTPGGSKALIGTEEFNKMQNCLGLINCSRGGIIDETALVDALNSGKILFAGLDVFENEPKPSLEILHHPRISLTPHIGASTGEAQTRIGEELAEKILALANA